MEILLWLVPPALVTVLAMLWAGWRGREPRRDESRDEAVRRLGEALTRPSGPSGRGIGRLRRAPVAPGYRVPSVAPDPSTGVAVRTPRRPAD
ncbi:hypothetical protein [Nocardioides salsibiostraticola]